MGRHQARVCPVPVRTSNAPLLGRTAAVMRQRCDVLDGLDRQPGGLDGRDGALAPEPGPLTLTSTSLTPYLVAVAAAVSAARCAAKGVLLRLPLNPTVPDEAQHNASPLGSVIVTVVLLNVALMCTTARLTLRRVFRFLALATAPVLLNQSDPMNRMVVSGLFIVMPEMGGTGILLGPGVALGTREIDQDGPGKRIFSSMPAARDRVQSNPTATAR